ncbi:MAG TPA: heme exporter protein CcmD [Burkholderiales bacterium]|nr:heme exporter protein CcmD [Burkholderiales bacterium]
MNWGSAQAFFAMGGYALYVWGAYGVAAACILLELWVLRRRRRTLERDLSRKDADDSSGQI